MKTTKSGRSKGSEIFLGIIEDARQQLLLDYKKSEAFKHSGTKGDEREAALITFFKDRISSVFEIATGEVIDCYDHRTGQLDIIIYDKLAAAPISKQVQNCIIPCEAVYAIIEVKSILNKTETNTCLKAAQSIRKLKPFKQKFVDARTGGAAAKTKLHRCLYVVFAYKSDLSKDQWITKEFDRFNKCSAESKISLTSIDRIFVADRGIINPIKAQGKVVDNDPEYLFVELFLHVINFIERERERRPHLSWQTYALPRAKGWIVID